MLFMARERKMVQFGFEPVKQEIKGTLFILDPFQGSTLPAISKIIDFSEERKINKVVFYPLSGETLKRMGIEERIPFYKRVKELTEGLDQISFPSVTIDQWDGKRKKYTPVDLALSYLTEKYNGPHFLLLSLEMANLVATYQHFETWIKHIRLFIIARTNVGFHPKLEKFKSRWEVID